MGGWSRTGNGGGENEERDARGDRGGRGARGKTKGIKKDNMGACREAKLVGRRDDDAPQRRRRHLEATQARGRGGSAHEQHESEQRRNVRRGRHERVDVGEPERRRERARKKTEVKRVGTEGRRVCGWERRGAGEGGRSCKGAEEVCRRSGGRAAEGVRYGREVGREARVRVRTEEWLRKKGEKGERMEGVAD